MPPERGCKGTRADGTPCGAPGNLVDPETGVCPAHAENARERLSEAGRKGARATARKLQRKGLEDADLPPLDSPQAAEKWLETVGRAVAVGRLGHHEGKTVVRAVREFLRAHEAGQVSERLDALLDALDKWRETGDPEPVLSLVN